MRIHMRRNKQELRRELEALRDRIPCDEKRGLDRSIQEHLLQWEVYRAATSLFCYVSFRSEVETIPIIAESISQGKIVSVPKIDLDTCRMYAFIVENTDTSLKEGAYGIPEPVQGCREVDYSSLELIVAPGLAFTLSGERLGYGGGYYDRFMEIHNHPTICALTYDRMILDEIPVKDHDISVDYVITESGVKSVQR
jgi:5-formyltetrahydrofolate cyclo-ligase